MLWDYGLLKAFPNQISGRFGQLGVDFDVGSHVSVTPSLWAQVGAAQWDIENNKQMNVQ